VLEEIEWLSSNSVAYIMPADANFGLFADRDMEIADKFVNASKKHGYPKVVGMAFAKNSNALVIDIAQRLNEHGLLKALTLSAQSMTPEVLVAIKRKNMAISDFASVLQKCNEKAIPTYTELILGLPEETLVSWKKGLCQAISCGQHNQLESWLLEMLENAPMNDPEYISRYGLKTVRLKNYAFVFDKQANEEAPEEIPIVYETNAMPFGDFQRALGFSMIIYNLHAYGWTQCISRFLNQVCGIGYFDFYTKLEEWTNANPETILHREYQATVETIRAMVETQNYVVDRWLLGRNVGTIPIGLRSQGFFHIESEASHFAIEEFVRAEYGELIGEPLESLLEFQRHFVTNAFRSYPYEMEFDWSFADLLSDILPAKGRVKYVFESVFDFDELDTYITLIYSKKKQGFGKARIRQCVPDGWKPAVIQMQSY